VVLGVWGVKTAKKIFQQKITKIETLTPEKKIMSAEMVPKLFPSLLSMYISEWKCSKNQI
jgi:hypothetical protein